MTADIASSHVEALMQQSRRRHLLKKRQGSHHRTTPQPIMEYVPDLARGSLFLRHMLHDMVHVAMVPGVQDSFLGICSIRSSSA